MESIAQRIDNIHLGHNRNGMTDADLELFARVRAKALLGHPSENKESIRYKSTQYPYLTPFIDEEPEDWVYGFEDTKGVFAVDYFDRADLYGEAIEQIDILCGCGPSRTRQKLIEDFTSDIGCDCHDTVVLFVWIVLNIDALLSNMVSIGYLMVE